jgi:hypothetical protein
MQKKAQPVLAMNTTIIAPRPQLDKEVEGTKLA